MKPLAKNDKPQKNDALPSTANNRFGNGIAGIDYKDELNTSLPNSFVDNSGDSNQISRSEEQEMENNTPTREKNKFNPADL